MSQMHLNRSFRETFQVQREIQMQTRLRSIKRATKGTQCWKLSAQTYPLYMSEQIICDAIRSPGLA